MELPLLIGGATTSRQHTAVRIAPEYTPAHRARARRLARDRRGRRAARAGDGGPRSTRRTASSRSACARSTPSASGGRSCRSAPRASAGRPIAWHADDLAVPLFTGERVVEPALAELRGYVDWTFFFHAWDLKGRYPAILDHPEKGDAARDLFDAANALLDRIVEEGLLDGTGRPRLLAGGRRGRRHRPRDGKRRRPLPDAPSAGSARRLASEPLARGLRGARRDRARRPRRRASPSGSTAPTSSRRPSRRKVTTTARSWSRRSPTGSPRRSPSGSTSRRGARGTRRTSSSPSEDLVAERFRGHPAGVRVPRVPRPLGEGDAVRAARAERAGLALTESCASLPGASVSGLYSGIPRRATSRSAGSAATRSRTTRRARASELAVVERWLRPNLAYDPR